MTRGIQETDVWAAADALLMEGGRPTIERVRQKIGRGSPNTVSPMLDRWFADLGKRVGGSTPVAEDRGVPVPIAVLCRGFWDNAVEYAAQVLKTEGAEQTASLERREQALNDSTVHLEAERTAVESRASAIEEALGMAKSLKDQAEQRLNALETQHVQALTELTNVQRDLASERRHVQEATDRLLFEQGRSSEERTRLEERSRVSERRAAEEVDLARVATKEALAACKRAEAQSAAATKNYEERGESLKAELANERASVVTQKELLREARSQTEAAATRLLDAKSAAAAIESQLREQVHQLNGQLADLSAQLKLKDDEQNRLLRSLLAATGQVAKKSASRRGNIKSTPSS